MRQLAGCLLKISLTASLLLQGQSVDPDAVRSLALLLPSITQSRYPDPSKIPMEALQLQPQLAAAYRAQKVDEAWRIQTKLLWLVLGEKWDAGAELASSYDVRLSRRIVEPGDPLEAALVPAFKGQPAEAAPYRAKLSLRQIGKTGEKALKSEVVNAFPAVTAPVATTGLKDGEYVVRYELTGADGTVRASAERPFSVRHGLRRRLLAIDEAVKAMERKSKDNVRWRAAVETAEYARAQVEKALGGYHASARLRAHPVASRIPELVTVGRYVTEPFDLNEDLARAERMLLAISKGKDPLRDAAGELRLAYRSSIDGVLLPYRLFVPRKPSGAAVLMLHGAGGDEGTYLGGFTEDGQGRNLSKRLAGDGGYLLISPSGRGPFGGYAGNAEQDVLDVLAKAGELFPGAAKQVFLTGHSMGAMGTWSLGFKHAGKFAGLAPVAGAANISNSLFEKAPELPVLLLQGGKDALTVPGIARQAAELAKKKLREFEYREYPLEDHFSIGAASLPDVFAFFSRIRRKL